MAVVCFILFPLEFTFRQPETDGLAGMLFAALTSFDKPFNQAPSLHIALLVILWRLYARHLPRLAQWPLHIWFALVGVSVLTTYQHHFFDIPTGALLGVFCLWLWPERETVRCRRQQLATDRRRLVLATRYLIGGGLIAALALWIGGAGLWLLWPAVSLGLVAANYAVLGPEGFQKDADGRMSLAARLLLAPYLAGAFVNSRAWTRHEPAPVAIGDGVWLGRIPLAREAAGFATVVDLCAELPGAATAANVDVHPDARSRPAATGTIARRRGEHRARALRRAGAGLLRARLLAKRRHGRDLAGHEQRPRNDERGDREGPCGRGLASSSIRRCAPPSRPQRSEAHDRAHATALLFCAAALLDQGRTVDRLSRPLTAAALIGILVYPAIDRPAAVDAGRIRHRWLRSPASRRLYFAIRVGFDAALFHQLASAPEAPDFAGTDAALARLGLLPAATRGRPAEARVAGAKRLFGFQVLAAGGAGAVCAGRCAARPGVDVEDVRMSHASG